jgi:excisionase family DNA binding protein
MTRLSKQDSPTGAELATSPVPVLRAKSSLELPQRHPPLAVSPAEAAKLAGLGRTTIYRAISLGELKSLKVNSRRLIAIDVLRAWLMSHEVSS